MIGRAAVGMKGFARAVVALAMSLPLAGFCDTWLDYIPMENDWAALLWSRQGSAGAPVAPMSRFTTTPVRQNGSEPAGTDIHWGTPNNWNAPNDSIEEWRIKRDCKSGTSFVWLYAYRDVKGHRFAIRTLRSELIDLVTQKTQVLTDDCPDAASGDLLGHPYALFNVSDRPYKIRVWMVILDIHGKPGTRAYWEHTIEPPRMTLDSCWESDSTKTRPAMRQAEAWWQIKTSLNETEGKWTLGGGGTPFSRDFQPVDPGRVWAGRFNFFAKGVGAGWVAGKLDTSGEPTENQFCMRFGSKPVP